MTSEPLIVAVCAVGLLVALAALLPLRPRAERWVAIGGLVLAVAAVGMLALACAAFDRVYAGVTLGLAASVSLAAGALVWEREARGREETASVYVRLFVPLIVVGIAVVAIASTWTPPANDPPDVPIMVH